MYSSWNWVWCALGLLLFPTDGGAQLRAEILIPGSTTGVARVLELEPAPERSRFMLEIIRALHDQAEGVDDSTDTALASLNR